MGTNIKEMPPRFIELQKKFSPTQLQAMKLNKKLFIYDGEDNTTGEGFRSKEAFVGSLIYTTPATFEIAMSPSVLTNTEDFSIDTKFLRNIINYNQRDDDPATMIYSQEMPQYLLKRQLDLRDKLIFFTQESIYTGESIMVDRQIAKFVVANYENIFDEEGVFQYAYLTLKKIMSYKSKKIKVNDSGDAYYEQIIFNWYKASIQPINFRRRRITFKSRPIIWGVNFKGGENNLPKSYKNLTADDWAEDMFLPSISATNVSFSPTFSLEKTFLAFGVSHSNASEIMYPIAVDRLGGDEGYDEIHGYIEATSQQQGFMDFSGLRNGRYGFPNRGDKDGRGMQASNYPIYGGMYSASGLGVFETFGIGGTPPKKFMDYFFSKAEEIMNFVPPISITGVKKIAKSEAETGSAAWPRVAEQLSAVWIVNLEEALWFYDVVIHSELLGIAGTGEVMAYWSNLSGGIANDIETKKTMIRNVENNKIPDYVGEYEPYIGSQKQRDNKDKLLQGNLDWMGNSYTEKPSVILTKSFDFSPLPKDWNIDEMKKYFGLYPTENIRIPCNIDRERFRDMALKLPVSATSPLVINALKSTISLRYKNFVNMKATKMEQNFYIDEDGEYIIEFELDRNLDALIEFDMYYFGGYKYTTEDFQNTKEDADKYGDKYCVFTFNGIEYDLPPMEYTADNLMHDPRTAQTKKVYGSPSSKSNLVLKEKLIRDIKDNKKKITNYKTGKTEKNKSYQKKKFPWSKKEVK